MNPFFRLFSSMRLTVWLLALSMIMIFFGTLDQARFGIRYTQEMYFESLLAFWQYPMQWPGGRFLNWLHLPIPGGYLIGPLLLVNLVTAHFRYFRMRWRTLGIAAIHGGIALLLIGQLLNQVQQEDNFMWIEEGETANYLQSFHRDELVIIDKTDPETDRVISIPQEHFRRAPQTIQHHALPFRVTVHEHFKNAVLARADDLPGNPEIQANRGIAPALNLVARERPPTYVTEERNMTTAVVELVGPNNSLGTWLVSNIFEGRVPPQRFEFNGRKYEISLRFERRYLPYEIELLEFAHDRYPGTEIPRNFSSLVHLRDPRMGDDRPFLIYMNHPLRYDGLTFYQASFGNDDTASMFQVVENPSWWIPYAACTLVTLGLLFQFGYVFRRFLLRRIAR